MYLDLRLSLKLLFNKDVEEQKTSVQLDESSLEYMTKEEPSDYLEPGKLSCTLYIVHCVSNYRN